jgi:hypothetical protein
LLWWIEYNGIECCHVHQRKYRSVCLGETIDRYSTSNRSSTRIENE